MFYIYRVKNLTGTFLIINQGKRGNFQLKNISIYDHNDWLEAKFCLEVLIIWIIQ